nr:MAG TPA: hypothetical protein [Caudoviricetes sp.]
MGLPLASTAKFPPSSCFHAILATPRAVPSAIAVIWRGPPRVLRQGYNGECRKMQGFVVKFFQFF